MKKIFSLPKKYLASLLLFIGVIFAIGFHVSNVHASGNINGFGWADGVGWFSLNCATGGPGASDICGISNYGLSYNAGGTITGYAWSDNMGWVKFDGGCPSGTTTIASNHPCSAQVIDGATPTVRGFAKITNFFLNGNYCKNPSTSNANNCGWSNPESAGYISLSSINDQDPGTVGVQEATAAPYAVAYQNGALNGYGWNPLIGWVQFTGTPQDVTVHLEPADGVISTCSTTPITLSWSSTNATSCSGSWSGSTTLPTSGTATVTGAGTYTVTCNGVTSNAVTVTTTTTPGSCVTLTGAASYCEYDDTTTVLNWTTPASATCVASWDPSLTFTTPGPTSVSVFDNEIGDNLYFVTCNGAASNTVNVHVNAAGSSSCSDAEPPTLSIDASVMCTDHVQPVNLSYLFDGTSGSTCTSSWGASIPGDSASVSVNPSNTPGTYSYSVTCDGMQSNTVSLQVLSSTDPTCAAINCQDPNADNFGSPLPCTYGPPDLCTDPVATNFGLPKPCLYGPGGNGKPIIEEF